jgi:hypothetical protein
MIKYDEYVKSHTFGLRKITNDLANDVVLEWEKTKDVEFAYRIVRERFGHKVNHILFTRIVFPVIKSGIRDREYRAIRMAIECMPNIHSDRVRWEEIGFITELGLLRLCLEIVPNDKWAKGRYLDSMAGWLRYSIHEWPSGVLYGHDGATIAECGEILRTIEGVRAVDVEGKYSELLDDVEVKTQAYLIKLQGG